MKTRESSLTDRREAFEIEVTKLSLHNVLNPGNKIIWIGTGRSVLDAAKRFPGKGLYLNCDDAKWSWELNRKYLEYALAEGFTFKLLEQASEDATAAIKSTNISDFIIFLLRKMLPNLEAIQVDPVKMKTLNTLYPRDKVHEDDSDLPPITTQYDGSSEPTATMQEILALKEIGCIVQIDEENTICFLSKKRAHRTFSESDVDGNLSVAILTSQEAPGTSDRASVVYPETNPLSAVPSSTGVRAKSQATLDLMPILRSLTSISVPQGERDGVYLLLCDTIQEKLKLLSELSMQAQKSDPNITDLLQKGDELMKDLAILRQPPSQELMTTMVSTTSKAIAWLKAIDAQIAHMTSEQNVLQQRLLPK